jgi:hypothetical protein
MTYYRIAIQSPHAPTWRWQTTKLTSLHAVLDYLHLYRCPQHARQRVFFTSSVETFDNLLALENQGGASFSVPAEQLLHGPLQAAELEPGNTDEASAHEHQLVLPTGIATKEDLKDDSTSGLPVYAGSSPASEARRLEIELGTGGDHDLPYIFAFPRSMPESLAWIRLRASVQRGEREA